METNYVKINSAQKASEIDSYTAKRYLEFVKFLPNNLMSILDYGCNTGRGGVKLRQCFTNAQIIGCDIVKQRLDEIPEGVYNSIFDLNKIQLTGAVTSQIDAIVSGEVVEHIPIDILVDILKTFFSLLKKDGVLIITTPNPNSLLVKLGRNAVLKDPAHVNVMSCSFLTELLQNAGFKQVSVYGAGKASKYLGNGFPLFLYGSYMLVVSKE